MTRRAFATITVKETRMKIKKAKSLAELPGKTISGSGLLNRRALLRGALFSAGLAAAHAGIAEADVSISTNAPQWMKTPGRPFSGYGMPAKSQEKVQRSFTVAPGREGTGVSR